MSEYGEYPGSGKRLTWQDWKRCFRALSWRDLTESLGNIITYAIIFASAYIFLWLFVNLR